GGVVCRRRGCWLPSQNGASQHEGRQGQPERTHVFPPASVPEPGCPREGAANGLLSALYHPPFGPGSHPWPAVRSARGRHSAKKKGLTSTASPFPFVSPERSTQVDRDGFDFRVKLKGIFAQLAANARHLEAAKGSSRVKNVVAVDPDGAGP